MTHGVSTSTVSDMEPISYNGEHNLQVWYEIYHFVVGWVVVGKMFESPYAFLQKIVFFLQLSNSS